MKLRLLATLFVLSLSFLLGMVVSASAQNPQATTHLAQGARLASVSRTRPALRAPFTLTAKEQQYLDSVLKYWEFSSSKVTRFYCTFRQWEYNAFSPNRDTAAIISDGIIKYARPDKGLYRIDEMFHYTPARNPQEKASYAKRDGTHGEYWVCDGKSIFEYDYLNKHLIERKLPKQLQGDAISNGPLPFLFSAKVAQLNKRFWMRPMQVPENVKGEYWIDARPKFAADAADFQRLWIILDEKEFLPKAIQVYLPGGNERKVYQFANRKVNDPLAFIKGDFSVPSLPRGWKKRVDEVPGQ